MKIVEQNAGLLSNQEVAQVLRDRGADPSAGLNARAKASEKTVYEHLTSQSCAVMRSREQLKAVISDLKPFSLTRAELVQVLNLVPSSVVEVHLIVEGCEERLTEEQVEQLLDVVAAHLGARAGGSNSTEAMQE